MEKIYGRKNIRLATQRDIKPLSKILRGSILADYYFTSDEKAIETISRGVSKGEIYLIEKDKPLGFIWFYNAEEYKNSPYIHLLCVDGKERFKGYGRDLVEFLEKTFKPPTSIYLFVDDFNSSVFGFYEALGFFRDKRIPNPYRENVEVTLMKKDLK